MKAQDFRIGNYVHPAYSSDIMNTIVHDKIILEIDAIGQDSMCVVEDNIKGIRDICNIAPIKLTEEWLIKFGFKSYNNGFYRHHDLLISLSGQCWLVLGNDDTNNNPHPIFNKIDSIHQLQNLYFALTGEELTIK